MKSKLKTEKTANYLTNRETISTGICDIPEWHHGREDYSVWIIEIGGEEILQKICAARDHLSEFLIPPHHQQPHITILSVVF